MECGRKLPFTDGKAFSGPATDEGEAGPSLPTVVCRPLLRNVFLLVLFSIDKHCGSMSFPLLFSGRKRTDFSSKGSFLSCQGIVTSRYSMMACSQ